MHKKMRMTIAGTVLLLANSAFATPSYVGSFNVFDGPSVTLAPLSLSALDVAAQLFGGLSADYAISVNSSLNPGSITHTAWLDGYWDTQYLQTAAPESFVMASSSGRYDDYPAYSAWVCDHAECVADGYRKSAGYQDSNYTNFVWRLDGVAPPVPEPFSFLMFLTAIPMLFLGKRRYGKETS